MNPSQEYQRKLISAEEAAGLVKSGMWVDYGAICGFPSLIDEKLAARAKELKDVKIRAEHSHTVIPGIDPAQARRAAFLHDIGKAVSHELSGSHALVGAEIARRFGEDPAVVHAIEAHHNEVEPRTLTAVIVQASE